jgi:hypothetical protein
MVTHQSTKVEVEETAAAGSWDDSDDGNGDTTINLKLAMATTAVMV